ncbi:hypothetical protein CAEBREN_28777 [Caenorhabditis brenneri]|uniref:NR LBD domain-containing protein n=1 Tax=Caenorhabditis brenneri TaxID=135651 RepID=G0PKP6_CAEBE|nr:hypothetical protein CAEBREN_28777 [Caenorhabditis brenneri]
MKSLFRSSCRHCRFKKCLEVGMSANNVQWHRDVNANERQSRKIRDLCEQDDDPTLPGSSKPRVNLESLSKTENQLYREEVLSNVDYESIEQEVKRIFQSDLPATYYGYFASLGPLHKFVEGLRLIRTSQKTRDIKFENRLSIETLILHWKSQAKNVAVLLMHCIMFRSFSLAEKLRLFRKLWKSIYRFERIQMSVELFGEECASEKIIVISSDLAIQLDDLFFEIESLNDNNLEFALESCNKFIDRCVAELATPLFQLKVSMEELAFIILNFTLDTENIPKTHSEVCSVFMDQIANELHNYYCKNEVIDYALRIAKLMKILRSMKKIHNDDLAGVFVRR